MQRCSWRRDPERWGWRRPKLREGSIGLYFSDGCV
jgi:hypothetical protein